MQEEDWLNKFMMTLQREQFDDSFKMISKLLGLSRYSKLGSPNRLARNTSTENLKEVAELCNHIFADCRYSEIY